MMRRRLVLVASALAGLLVGGSAYLAQQPAVPGAATGTSMAVESQQALLQQYCQGCHNDRTLAGGFSLASFDLTKLDDHAEQAEKIIRKLKTGLMPPATTTRRPDAASADAFVRALETHLDRSAAAEPNPGTRPFQRLTRDEYGRSVEALLGVQVDVAKYLPPDTVSEGLDNIADSQPFSASLMEGYMRAAAQISREALGDPGAEPGNSVYKVDRTASQLRQMPGAPFGTRGGISIMFNFPADGEYNFRSLMHGTPTGGLFGNQAGEELEVSIDGERASLLPIDQAISETSTESGLNLTTGPIFVKAGPHRVSAAFLKRHSEIVEDDIAEIEHSLVDTDIGRDRELTVYPHLREFEVTGPFNVSGVSDTVVRRRVFTCRPLSPEEELPCATEIVEQLAARAYRRPTTSEDMEGLMGFYEQARTGGDFEAGIRTALQAILTSPDFLFKLEPPPTTASAGQNYRISDLALASRLSYFLWGQPPDDQLIQLASDKRLQDATVLEQQVRRLLADERSSWLATKFGAQWLHLADLQNFHPDPFYYSQYDATLAHSLLRETELFFDSMVRDDRNVLDLLTADYTFVDERLALHYGIPGVRGGLFRRVPVPADYRRGLLGKGAILALTSVADRTSPVLRGKWVMSVLLGTPPPPPPPAVPTLDQTPAVATGKTLTVRERMAMHRSNPNCNSCHSMIDPIGLALENFDVTGEWRTWDKTYAVNSQGVRVHTAGIPIDSKTNLYDGTPLDGPASLRQALLKYSESFIETLTEKMLAFAIGRRVEYFDMPAIRSITRAAAQDQNRMSSLILGIVKSPAFQMSRVETNTAEQRAAAVKQ